MTRSPVTGMAAGGADDDADARYRRRVSDERPEAGWYPDPAGSPDLRWWDGERWTDDTHPSDAASAAGPGASSTASSTAAAVATTTAPAPPPVRDRTEPATHPARAILLIIVLLVVALVAATALVASLNRPKLNTGTLERQIAQDVADAASVGAVVRCPDRVDLMKGATFTCDIELDGGQTATAIVTQTDDRGSVSWKLDTSGSGGSTP